jgi:hypothetical protein
MVRAMLKNPLWLLGSDPEILAASLFHDRFHEGFDGHMLRVILVSG